VKVAAMALLLDLLSVTAPTPRSTRVHHMSMHHQQ
jgi:hypothetical protein